MIAFTDIHSHQSKPSTNTIHIKNIYKPSEYDELNFVDHLFSIGIHPKFINELSLKDDLKVIADLATKKNVVAIGESGLDRLSTVDFKLQEFVFKEMIQLSEDLKKPLIIHAVKTIDEIIHHHKKIKPAQPWIFHGFNRKLVAALKLIDQGIISSFGHALLSNTTAQETLARIPEGTYFLETDDSLVSIDAIFAAAARIRSMEVESLQIELMLRFKKIFQDER